MDLIELKKELTDAVNNNTLLTPKHDPNNLNTIYSTYRSVLSHEASSSLCNLINSGNYTVHQFENTNPNHTPYYMKIIPNSGSSFSIAASGVNANSSVASTVLDSLVIVSGSSIGWHMFGVDNAEILNKVTNGDLIDKGILT